MKKRDAPERTFEEVSTVSPNSIHNITTPEIEESIHPSEGPPNDDNKPTSWSLRRRNILNLSLDLSNIRN